MRAEGALLLPGFVSLSVFFRRASQTASTVELKLWTAPIYFRPLDEDNFSNNPAQYLLPLAVEPATGLQVTGAGAQVFGDLVWGGRPSEIGRESDSRRFAVYLDVGTTVAVAQLQLLRDAMVHQYAVAIYFLDDSYSSGREDATGFHFAYEVMVIPVALGDGVITAGTVQW